MNLYMSPILDLKDGYYAVTPGMDLVGHLQ